MTFDESYIKVIEDILVNGKIKKNRTGVDTFSIFNRQICAEEDASGYENIPISNLRKIHWKGALIEVFWLLGLHMNDYKYRMLPITNTQYLLDNNVKYWQPWADEHNNLGPVYGSQLVSWKVHQQKNTIVMDESDYICSNVKTINQIQNIINKLRTNPDDRRLVATMWNPSELEDMALPPCHHTMEFYSEPTQNGRVLHTRWMQRSCDMPIGIPYDILVYTFINKIVALCSGHIPGKIYGLLGDCHIYENQIEQSKELIKRSNSEEFNLKKSPKLIISDRIHDIINEKRWCELYDFKLDGSDFTVNEYAPLDVLKIPVAV